MPANLTEGSANSSGTTQTPDSHTAVCFPTTSTEVMAGEERGSFYSSFKVSVLPATPHADSDARDTRDGRDPRAHSQGCAGGSFFSLLKRMRETRLMSSRNSFYRPCEDLDCRF